MAPETIKVRELDTHLFRAWIGRGNQRIATYGETAQGARATLLRRLESDRRHGFPTAAEAAEQLGLVRS